MEQTQRERGRAEWERARRGKKLRLREWELNSLREFGFHSVSQCLSSTAPPLLFFFLLTVWNQAWLGGNYGDVFKERCVYDVRVCTVYTVSVCLSVCAHACVCVHVCVCTRARVWARDGRWESSEWKTTRKIRSVCLWLCWRAAKQRKCDRGERWCEEVQTSALK